MVTHRVSTCLNKNGLKSILIAATLALFASQFSACTKKYGWFHLDKEVSRSFQAGVVLKGYQYYYSGREPMPYAIVGIEKGYTIISPYWVSFEPEPDRLKKMSGNIFGSIHRTPDGAYIFDPTGNVVGVWYSNVQQRTVSVDPENRTVSLLFTNPENRGGSR
jgi:hypothetical protein